METETTNIRYSIRDLAKIIIEAKTPFRIGSGLQSLDTDSTVLRDFNGLPYIPGTSLAGILRSTAKEAENIFGSKESGGSRLIISEAKILKSDGRTPVDSSAGPTSDNSSDNFLNSYKFLPIRQHVRIGDTGTGIKGAKFDEEVVFKGTRLCFEMEYLAEGPKDEALENFLQDIVNKGTLHIGSGVYHGFGEFEIKETCLRRIDLSNENDLNAYLDKTSSLNDTDFWNCKKSRTISSKQENSTDEIIYRIKLKSENFIFFGGSNAQNSDEDMSPICETYVEWNNKGGTFKESKKSYIIPGASIKGALAHRIAFHYNVLNKNYIIEKPSTDNNLTKENITGKNNEAVKFLFGTEGDNKGDGKQCGKVIISDIFLAEQFTGNNDIKEKLLNHVIIDSFSGGAIKGGLFSEKVLWLKPNTELEIKITVKGKKLLEEEKNKNILKALENTLNDLTSGMLALGGNTNRGYGIFTGKWEK